MNCKFWVHLLPEALRIDRAQTCLSLQDWDGWTPELQKQLKVVNSSGLFWTWAGVGWDAVPLWKTRRS